MNCKHVWSQQGPVYEKCVRCGERRIRGAKAVSQSAQRAVKPRVPKGRG